MVGWRVKGDSPLANPEQELTCSLCKVPTVYIEPLARFKIERLLELYPHQEWAGFLAGRTGDDGIFVEDIAIPPHKPGSVSGGSAELDRPDYDAVTGKYDFHRPVNCVGFIHSHDSLGAFHSGTDDGHVDRNYPVSVTVAKRGDSPVEYDTVYFAVTQCGKATRGKAVVKYVAMKPQFDVAAWLVEAQKNIDRPDTARPLTQIPFVPRNQRILGDVQGNFQRLTQGTGLRSGSEQGRTSKEKPYWLQQPRDEHGKFLQRLDSRLQRVNHNLAQGEVITDGNGVVISQSELQSLLDSGMEID